MNAHIQVLGWNHRQEVGPCIASCLRQTLKTPILYIDNGSSDGSVKYIREKFPDVSVVENTINKGYSGGHNDGLKAIADSEIAILLNPDVILEENFTEEIIKKFDLKIGAVVPFLFREKKRNSAGGMEIIMDSYGTKLLRNGRAVNNFEGEIYSDKFLDVSVWGFTGAGVAISREAISDISENGKFFDEQLHSYREDVDISWRLQNRGWKIVGAPNARAWHARVARIDEKKSSTVRRLSWRNYFLVIIKNASPEFIRKNAPFILWEVFMRAGQCVVTPALWKECFSLLKLMPHFLRKRGNLSSTPKFPSVDVDN